MATLPDAGGADAIAVLSWLQSRPGVAVVRPLPPAALMERWFSRAADRFAPAWHESRRSPAALLWIAARAAALEHFDADALALFDERAAMRTGEATLPRSVAELLAVGDVLAHLGVITTVAATALPPALVSFTERRARHAA